MKIAVNTRFLLPRKLEGFGWYTYETLRRITKNHPEHEFIFIFDRPFDSKFIFNNNVTPVVVGPQARHPFLFYLWFEHSIPKVLRKHKADLFVSPDGYLSLSAKTPQLAVMHDLNFEHNPGDLTWLVRNYYKHYFPRFAAKAKRIVTVSDYSRNDIIERYQIHPDKIETVYNGVNEAIGPVDEGSKKKVREQYTHGLPYFVFIGAQHPRKNLAGMFKAYDLFRKSHHLPHRFVIVGEKYFWNKEITEVFEAMQHRSEVVFTGHLNMDDLRLVLGSAEALAFVSHFEGFGLPIAEAMRAEVPVITGTNSSLPEIAGNAALLCDSRNPEAIAKAMADLASDKLLREKMIALGLEQVRKFSWDKSAEGLWSNIEKCLYA